MAPPPEQPKSRSQTLSLTLPPWALPSAVSTFLFSQTLHSVHHTITMATTLPMPACRDCSAPQFDPKKLWELHCFFNDLSYQFTRSQVTDDAAKKKHAVCFVNCDTTEQWELLPKFKEAARTYDEIMEAVYKLYPGSTADQHWVIVDMDKLIGETSHIGILSLADLGKYHHEFITITTFLITKNQISATEQSHTFVQDFPPKLWAHILQ